MFFDICIYTGGLCLIDKILTNFNFKGQYYFNHFIVNSFITYFCFNDVIFTFTDFDNMLNYNINITSINLVFSIHFYHIIMYYYKFILDDWLHHIIMIFFTLPMGLYFNGGSLMNYCIFFTTGLPGGINYILLFLE